ncbi:uncharacterized protein LOC129920016 [Episyrphus balteatus]|uniref:uncharacterized protein LOC129920016 n=1 Tax=Episyrphus balteatus TaxID=286459 RepID=UPI0024861C33|nr:uncharacterized protein LOC129920016 [Episyrphus balteatus]
MPKFEFLAETMRCRKTSGSILQPVNTNDLPRSDFFDTETSLNVEALDDNFIDIDNTPEITLTPNYSKTQLPSTSSAVSLQSTPLANPAALLDVLPPTPNQELEFAMHFSKRAPKS